MEAISDVSYDREVKACMTIPRMKGPDDVYSGETRVAILSPDGVVRKKDVLPGGFLTPAFIGKELEKTDMWPAEIVGTRDNRTKW